MNRLTSLALLALVGALSVGAQTPERSFYIDFGETNNSSRGNQTVGADANGHHWTNAYAQPTEKIYPRSCNLTSAEGTVTTCTMTIGCYFHTNGMSGGGGLTSPSKALLGDLAVATATQDYMHMEGGQDYSVVHFGGLDLDKAYRFTIFGSRNAADDRAGYFELTGENLWKGEMAMSGAGIGNGGYNGNNNKPLVSDYIFPDRSGNIDLTISKKYSGGMVYLNCMKIEEVSGLQRPGQELSLVQKMYIDFGEYNNNTRGHHTNVDANGIRWNNVSSGSSSSNVIAANKTVALYNSEKASTGSRLVVIDKSYTNGIDAGGNNNPQAADLGDMAIQTATEDYMFIDNGDARSFKLTKLNTAHCYRLYIYGSRNTTSDRCTFYTIRGQRTWTGGQTTSGSNVGGEGYPGNLRNVLQTDYIYPDRTGEILITMQRITGMAHINCMKIEEYEGGERPAEPLVFTSLSLSGNAEDATFKAIDNNTYEAYARLNAGSFSISGKTADGDVTLSDGGNGTFTTTGSQAFQVAKACVARITVNTASSTVTVLPVTMNVRGNIGAGNPAIPYKGAGVFEGEVTLQESASQQWVDKTMWFALNNNDSYAIKRRTGAATRYVLGEVEKGQGTENIYQNAGTYTITVDMNKMVYAISAPIDEHRISVFGSSVANGQGATDYKGYRYLYGQQLIERHNMGRSDNPFYTTNVSIGGNTTTNLLNRYDDLIRDFGRYVIFGLSLGNEGIHGASNQEAVFAQWRDNMLSLIKKVRADGKIPMVMNNYTRADYTESDYYYVKKLNLLIHEWDVPSTNVLGSIDKGNGQWADGYVSDTYHQNMAGHWEFMYAMVPSLFDAIKAGKPQPKRNTTKSMTIEAGKTIYFEPEETVHPFTVTARVKGTEGQVICLTQAGGTEHAIVKVNADGTVTYTAPDGTSITSTTKINDGNWHNVSLTSYYAQRRTLLYVDKAKAGEVSQRLAEIELVALGDADNSREVSELTFWRSGMTPEEIEAVVAGKMLKSSLEIYAPLGGKSDMENLAQSTNSLRYGVPAPKEFERAQVKVSLIADEGTIGFSPAEDFGSLFDGSTATKWCLNGGSGNSIYAIFHTSAPIYLTGYKISTANDNASFAGRNPSSWTLYGSTVIGAGKDDASWEKIATVAGDSKLQDVNQATYTYKLAKETAKAYQSFKWVITARKGGGTGVIQVSEFEPTYNDALVEVDPVARPRVTVTDRAVQDGRYYGTYVAPTDVDFTSTGVTAYAGQMVAGSYLHLEPVAKAPKGAALVVSASQPDTYPLRKAPGATLAAINDLLGSDGDVEGNGSVYALAMQDTGLGFYLQPTGTEVPAGEAYLLATAACPFYLLTEETATSLTPLHTSSASAPVYNLQGQRRPRPAKGINIQSGKKIAVK